jgi:ribosomal protein L11 methyltransferase
MAYHEFIITIEGVFTDALVKTLVDSGCLGVIEQDESLAAYFPESADTDSIIQELSIFRALSEKAGHAHGLTFTHSLIQEQDWNESWKKGFLPLDVGQHFTILPPWEQNKENRINLIIDPGMAFGTGHHETTRSCLVLMEKYVDRTAKGSFLDLGTGTGILAIAAYKLGYHRILGIDTDPLSIEAAHKNCELNSVFNIEIKHGSLSETDEKYNVIAANLISGVLIQLAPALLSRLKSGGIAFLSGILSGQEDEVIDAMQKARLELVEKHPDGKWVSLVVERHV